MNFNRQPMRSVVAKGCHCRIVVWSTPFAKDIGKAKDAHWSTGSLAIGSQSLFRGVLTLSIVVLKLSLNRRGKDNRDWPLHLPKRIRNGRGEPEIACHEL
ncbi:MAG: hypothetical protein BWY75_03570 [bacterium ADurb.Bin425]|nr:MAG: hypothetical protein BWY75_03570 [bacterium ADurb.Bin425]